MLCKNYTQFPENFYPLLHFSVKENTDLCLRKLSKSRVTNL